MPSHHQVAHQGSPLGSQGHRSSYRSTLFFSGLLILALSALHLWIRWPALSLPYFHNEDTAGITYSADLVISGGLPLIDTVEMKAPGSFFILAAWWELWGRSLESAQALGVTWSWLAMLGIMSGAWMLYRRFWSAALAGALYVYLAPFTDSIDINYSAWMITPYVWASFALFWARSRPDLKRSWIFAGVLIALAALMKRQGAAISLLAGWIIYEGGFSRKRAVTLITVGLSAMFLFAFSPYIWGGHGLEAIGSYFFSKSGWSYLLGNDSSVETASKLINISSSPPRLPRLWDGIRGLQVHLPLAGLLAITNLLISSLTHARLAAQQDVEEKERSAQRGEVSLAHVERHVRHERLLIVLAFTSFLGASLGLRFFKGYYLQMLPVCIWLSVNPHGAPWRAFKMIRAWRAPSPLGPQTSTWRMILLSLTLVGGALCLPDSTQASWGHLKRARAMRQRVLSLPAWQIKEVSMLLKKRAHQNLYQDPSLWVWGRWAWPAYFYTEMKSPTRYFKNLGVLTTQLSNTWNPKRRGTPTRFDPSTSWREAIAELSQRPPRFILIAKNESIRDFKALRLLLRERYQRLAYTDLKVRARSKEQLFLIYELID